MLFGQRPGLGAPAPAAFACALMGGFGTAHITSNAQTQLIVRNAGMNNANRHRPNNDGTGEQWTRNWTTGRDANRPIPFKGLFGPPFASRPQRNFLVRR